MKNKNIVIFSSGISEQNGLTNSIKELLDSIGYICVGWRDFFLGAKHHDSIALLPMLIKKIPTFDFAVLICEGHDITHISRGEKSETVKTMRDNVLFEIGLCAMAIGLNRTILVTDSEVRLPDDLYGKNGQLAIKQFYMDFAPNVGKEDVRQLCTQIDRYINQEENNINQVVIGAAASGACGYASNFICRTLEHIDEPIEITDGDFVKTIGVKPENVYLHIYLPNNLDENVLNEIRNKQALLTRGRVMNARSRPVEFYCYFEGEDMHIVDYPTNIVTSYDTARTILEMDADDTFDVRASERFVSKEMTLYKSTLKVILTDNFIRQVINEHYYGISEIELNEICSKIMDIVSNRLTIMLC